MARRAKRILRLTSLSLAILSVTLGAMIWGLHRYGIGERSTVTGQDPFFYFITTFEPQMLCSTALGFLICYGLTGNRAWLTGLTARWARIGPLSPGQLAGLSLIVVVAVGLGRHFAYHDYDVCADESLTHFQSEVFLQGHVLAPIPAKWQAFDNATAVPLLTVHEDAGNWCSEFLPIHSLLRVPETWLGFDGYTCALYLGLNLVLFYFLVRRLWPHHPTRAAVGLLIFATFPQVLIMSMSSYAMETHALLNTLWLLLYLSESPALFLLTPWVGVLCMGIHQPHIHPILAGPFVLLLALQRRFFEFFYFCGVYLAGLVFWVGYLRLIRPSSVGNGLLDKFGFSAGIQSLIQSGDVALFLTWSPLVLTLLLPLAVMTLRRKDSLMICCLLAFVLLAAVYVAWPTQGHGWGNRFLYPVIPLMLLLALHALGAARAALGRPATMSLIFLSAAFALAVVLPYRLWEVDQFESTHRAVHDVIDATDSDVVLLDTPSIWYGSDFVQNNPSLNNRPVVLSLADLTPAQLTRLKQEQLSLKILGIEDLRATGQPKGFIRPQD